MMNFADDLDIFFSDFAVTATYTPAAGADKMVKVIFDAVYESVSMYDGVAVSSASPAAHCKSADVVGVKANDALAIDGSTYRIAEIQPDGTGMTTLILSRDMI